MASTKKPRFGKLPPQYGFMFNPYPDQRISRCPLCEGKTGQRKVPLLIHVDPLHLISLNYTCRYCRRCDLLVAHKHEVEHLLTTLFRQYDPHAIGNRYLVVGTLEKSAWRESMTRPLAINETLPHTSDFAKYYDELRVTRPGWYKADQEPPIAKPPPSQEWVKRR